MWRSLITVWSHIWKSVRYCSEWHKFVKDKHCYSTRCWLGNVSDFSLPFACVKVHWRGGRLFRHSSPSAKRFLPSINKFHAFKQYRDSHCLFHPKQSSDVIFMTSLHIFSLTGLHPVVSTTVIILKWTISGIEANRLTHNYTFLPWWSPAHGKACTDKSYE